MELKNGFYNFFFIKYGIVSLTKESKREKVIEGWTDSNIPDGLCFWIECSHETAP